MKNFLLLIGCIISFSLNAQTDDNAQTEKVTQIDEGVTSVILVPHDYEDMEELEIVLETMRVHESFVDMKRSVAVYTPSGPSQDYKEVIEIHYKNLELLSDWRDKMEKEVPIEIRGKMGGLTIVFFQYRDEK